VKFGRHPSLYARRWRSAGLGRKQFSENQVSRQFVIVFGNEICYSGDMEHRANQKPLGQQAPHVRRILLMFFAFVYLFVGLAHTVACVDQAVAASISVDMKAASNEGSDDSGQAHSQAAAEHCSACAPVQMPSLVSVAVPSAYQVKLVFVTPALLLADHPRLDPPPPKF
jgi:hypothetical protein